MTAQDVSSLKVVEPKPALRPWLRGDRAWIVAFTAAALALRLPTIGRAYWIDEGISVGIASHRVSQIPGLLRQDGSPPLFYVILHYWIRLFGSSEVSTHLLPLTISLAAIPLAYWSAATLFDRRAAIAAAALFATNPFLGWYSTETRMYPLVVVLSLAGITFAWKAFRDRQLRDGVAAVVAYSALLYTHNWGIYLTLVSAAVLFGLALFRDDRRLAYAVIAGTALVVVVWLPWAPYFVAQASTTAAPWAIQPKIGAFFADPAKALGGTLGAVVAPLFAAAIWATRRSRSASAGHVAGLIGAIGILSALTGFLGAQLEPSWTVRYLAIIVAPLLIATAGALSHDRHGRQVVAVVCVSLAAWSAVGSLLPNASARYAKSNVAQIAHRMGTEMQRGDLVIVTQTEQVAVLAHYLPAGLVYATPTGWVPEPSVVDWRNLVTRLLRANFCTQVAPLVDSLPIGAHLLEVDPARKLGARGSTWARAVAVQISAADNMLSGDSGLEAIAWMGPGKGSRPFSPVTATLFVKTSGAPICG